LDKQHLDTFDKRIPGQLPTYRLDHYTSCGPIACINCNVFSNSFPLCIESATTCDNPRRFGDEIGRCRRFLTVGVHSRESANQCNVCHWTKIGDELRRLATAAAGTIKNLRRPLKVVATAVKVVAARHRFNAQRKLNRAQLN